MGLPACLLVPDLIRAPMARLLKRAAPRLKVLGHSEIPETHSIRIGLDHRSHVMSANHVKRFTARNSREALELVREAFGDDAVVLSTKPCAEAGVEVLAMAPDGVGADRAGGGSRAGGTRCRGARRLVPRSGRAGQAQRAAANNSRKPDARSCTRRRAARDEHAVVPGLRARTHAQAPPADCSRKRRHVARARSIRSAGRPASHRADAAPTPPAAPSHGGADANADHRRPTDAHARLAAKPAMPTPCAMAQSSHAGLPSRAIARRPAARAARAGRHDGQRAALDEGPDRGPLRRPGLHGEAAAPAAPGAR